MRCRSLGSVQWKDVHLAKPCPTPLFMALKQFQAFRSTLSSLGIFWLHSTQFTVKKISVDAFTLMLSYLSTNESIQLEKTKLNIDVHLAVL